MEPSGRRALQSSLLQLVAETGQLILPYHQTELAVTQKNDNTPVTEADMAAHHFIVEQLARLTPGIPCLTEESPAASIRDRHNWNIYWLVDPLDGTREFINGGNDYTVNIALVIDHKPVTGVIHLPVTGETWYAHQGDGAFFYDAKGTPQAIHTRSLPAMPVVAVGYRRYRGKLHEFLEKLGPHQILSHASSLKSCLVAAAQADIYPCFGPTSEWDTAAAQCIVEQAGGQLTDMAMQPLRYNMRATLENPNFIVTGDPAHNWQRLLVTD